jgi:uncharacterized protein (TIGR02147 family)
MTYKAVMKDQLAVQKLLRRKLAELQSRNNAYSVRAFANRLGIQPAATNEILKGERRVSRKMAERFAAKLHLDPSERVELLTHFPERARSAHRLPETSLGDAKLAAQKEVLRLSSDQFSVISDWIHFAILNLVKTKNAKSDPAWMAERLNLTEVKVAAAIERLERLGLLEKDSQGKWKRTYARVNTTDDVISVSVQKSHLNDLDLARQSILQDPIDRRDFSSMTIAISPALLTKAKEIMRRAQDEIVALTSESDPTEVYRVTNYLFPLTREQKLKTKNKPKEGVSV